MAELDPLSMAKVMSLLLSKERPRTDAIFFHARSFGDDDGLFELAGELLKSGTHYVAINGFDGGGHHDKSKKVSPGAEEYNRMLKSQDIPDDKIILSRPATYTRDENRAFLELARELGWQSAVVIAQPHQLLRIMLGALDEMKRF